ncbi:hypothetical protein M408DRAFT_23116 [Serendipita vermifera MAFF 305830]|uniref:Uncharacterized protein n=1 Tax=Serendipita vermifera MAFF 305830 TaxID=933852 RepID=A0A0C2XJW4_SERVB|nr:hypothetical protein M408DRAFT_23116 [Serendipita vermifera MAFF 305830]
MSGDQVLDDTYSKLTYYDNAWQSLSGPEYGGRYSGTVHQTTLANARVALYFRAESISVTCFFQPAGSNFTASVNGGLVGTYNTYSADSGGELRTILIMDNMDASLERRLVLQKAPNDNENNLSYLEIDSITLGNPPVSPFSSTASSQMPSSSTSPSLSQSSSSTTSNSLSQLSLSELPPFSLSIAQSQSQSPSPSSIISTPQSQPPSSSTTPSAGVIAGAVTAGFLVVVLVVAFIWYRRRRTRAGRPFTSPSPMIETGGYPDDKRSGLVTGMMGLPMPISSPSAPVREKAVGLVASSSSPERGTAPAPDGPTSGKSQLHARDNNGTGPSPNPAAPPSVPLPSSGAPGEVNSNQLIQENAMLRDRVRHFAALQRTGGNDASHLGYHEPPPEYVGRDDDEEPRI